MKTPVHFMPDPLATEFVASSEPHAVLPGRGQSHERDRLYRLLQEHALTSVSPEEVEAHFEHMPLRYWDRITKSDLVWGLETVHAFLRKRDSEHFGANSVVADWRPVEERGFTKVMVCAWDRPGLLTKIAAAFTALRVNILRADVFTRSDNLVLDVFEVCEPEHRHTADAARLQHLVFLLEGALHDPPRFVSLWAAQFHRFLDWNPRLPFRIEFDNVSSPDYTVLDLEGSDRLGLLHDILHTLVGCGLNVAQAIVDTQDGVARDRLYLTDFQGKKVADQARLESVLKALRRAIDLVPGGL